MLHFKGIAFIIQFYILSFISFNSVLSLNKILIVKLIFYFAKKLKRANNLHKTSLYYLYYRMYWKYAVVCSRVSRSICHPGHFILLFCIYIVDCSAKVLVLTCI